MSWFSKNYDKALLAGGALITIGLLYFGWSQLQRPTEDFKNNPTGSGNNDPAVDGAERIDRAMQSMDLDHGLKQAVIEGDRSVDLFTGIPLFLKRDGGSQAIDLLKGQMVHPPIDNEFWIKYRLDPGFADSPFRDPDGDGFSNLEEFRADSDPTDRNDHPPLITKLQYIEDESIGWLLKPGFLGQDGSLPVSYEDTARQKNKRGAGDPVAPGQLFFSQGAALGRFKFLGHIKREQMNPAINVVQEITIARFEDQKPNKAGQVYEIPAPLGGGQAGEFVQYDRSAILRLNALGAGGKDMVIEENTRFALPEDNKKKEYLLKSVTPNSVIVEYPGENGEKLEIEIAKGAMGRF